MSFLKEETVRITRPTEQVVAEQTDWDERCCLFYRENAGDAEVSRRKRWKLRGIEKAREKWSPHFDKGGFCLLCDPNLLLRELISGFLPMRQNAAKCYQRMVVTFQIRICVQIKCENHKAKRVINFLRSALSCYAYLTDY